MAGQRLGVGVVGAGRWAGLAHLPGWARDERCRIVGVCDLEPGRASAAAERYGAEIATQDYRVLLDRDDIDVIDVVTRDGEHFGINRAAIEAGKHVLSEKPVAHDHHDVRQVAELARSKGLKTKVGFTFRYSPAVRYLKDLIAQGDLGTPFIYNAYEQNSQWLSPLSPLRGSVPRSQERATDGPIKVASLEGYGAPVIDIGHWLMESDLTSVVGVLRNFVPERMIAATGQMARTNIDDGDIFIGEFASGAEEFGICETLKMARPDDVEFTDVEVPDRYYPPGGSPRESWRTLYYANLTANFASEVLGEIEGNEGNFDDGLQVQEVINAVEISHRERRWVNLPLDSKG